MKRNSEILDHAPPSDAEAERAVLACVLLEPTRFGEARTLSPDDFYNNTNRIIFASMCRLHAAGKPPDITMIVGDLRDAGEYNADSGVCAAWLVKLFWLYPHGRLLNYYTARVKEVSRRRHAHGRAIQLIQAAHRGTTGPELPAAANRRAKVGQPA